MKRSRPRISRGMSLIETMVVVSIIGILAAMGVPQFQQSVEQSRANIAAANLRAIWTAQRAFFLINPHGAAQTSFSSSIADLQTAKLLDPSISDDPGQGSSTALPAGTSYVFTIVSADTSTFTAQARRVNTSAWSGTLTIDQTGTITGTIQSVSNSSMSSITPAFP